MNAVKKINDTLDKFILNKEELTNAQIFIFISILAATIVLKVILIPYNMIDHGEAATRTWNALMWAKQPFFVLPISGNPGWFYIMGPILMVTREIYYTPIITMILIVSVAGIYIFKITLLLSDYKTALIAFFIFTFNPAIFRLNYMPVPQQFFLASMCIMVYYFILAVSAEYARASKKYFALAGIFSFIGILFRPEALFVILVFCLIALVIRKKGKYNYIILSLLFQIIWIGISYDVYGNFFETFNKVREYDFLMGTNIEHAGILFRLKGFFLPYYFIVFGLTFIVFYFFIRGLITLFEEYPFLILIILITPIFIPALINGIYGTFSSLYGTTRYFYLSFYFCSIIAAFGLSRFLIYFNRSSMQGLIAGLIILTSIPLSFIKEFVPDKYRKLFPKVIEFIVTTTEPADTKELVRFIDDNLSEYPSLIYDMTDLDDTSIFYVPFRTKMAPPDKVMIGRYNIPEDREGLKNAINDFMKKNGKGIVMFQKNPTVMNSIFTEALTANNLVKHVRKIEETDKWIVCVYE